MKRYASIGLCVGQSGPPDRETVYRHADVEALFLEMAALVESIRCIDYHNCGARGWECGNCKAKDKLLAMLETTK